MCASPQSNWLNTIAVRASHILPILRRFPWWKPRKTGGWFPPPPGKNQNRNHFVFLCFGVDPLNWQSFIEIGEMACSTTARYSRGHTLILKRTYVLYFTSNILHARSTIQSYTAQYRAINSYTQLHWGIYSYTELCTTTQSYTAIRSYRQLYTAIQRYTATQGCTQLYAAIQRHTQL